MTEPVPATKPVLALLRRLLWTAALALPAFGAKGVVGLTTLHTFGTSTDGALPDAALVQGSDGYFYGTTENGGAHDAGTVFQISSNGILTTLYSFSGGDDGGYPSGALVQGGDGNFYGTTSAEGDTTNFSDPWGYGAPGWGTVFKISANGALTTLYTFTGLADGGGPNGLIQGSDGYFYGTTGLGTVFQISSTGTFSTLGYPDGDPGAGLVQGSDGYFYGTTLNGGTSAAGENPGYGTVFKIATNGSLATLYSFTGGNDGGNPFAGLVQGSDGSFYGTTLYGGITYVTFNNGCGTIFKISTNGSLTTLHLFTGGKDGGNPYAGLVRGGDGNLYGTTYYGGKITPTYRFGYGTVFKINTDGSLTNVYSFTGLNDGDSPNGLIVGSDGSFYGTTQGAIDVGEVGTQAGTVFRLTIAPDPELTLIPSEADMILTWPTNYGAFSYAGYNLQAATNLGPSAVWTHVSLSPVVIGGQYVVVNPLSGTQGFFRLSQ
jgi:uncharacterized repeat protein (TIGR03803 family)